MLGLCYTCLQCRTDIRLLLLPLLCLSLNFLPILLVEGVFTTDYMRGELIAVFAAVTTDVALQWISVSMATHVDGVHDMVQEEHSTVLALEGPQLLALSSKHPHPVLAGRPLGAHPHHPTPHPRPASGRRLWQPLACIEHRRTGSRPEAGRRVAPEVALPLLRAAASRVGRVDSTVAGGFLWPFLGQMLALPG